MAFSEKDLGTKDIKTLLIRQAIPASVGILFMTSNILIDTILVGQWIGPVAIAALTVVTPIIFFIAAIGTAIGIGGGSVISRALGADDRNKAKNAFAHQIVMTLLISGLLSLTGLLFTSEILSLFGAKGELIKPASIFITPLLFAAPLQALCAVGNSVIRAEDKARYAMYAALIASVSNILLDILFIKVFDWGIRGAALATASSFVICFLYSLWFFLTKSNLLPALRHFVLRWKLFSEISALSFTTFARQGVISILSILLNNSLFTHGGENAVTVYGIISRMLMFALFPVTGLTEAFLPIAGFNHGAKKSDRVKQSIKTAIRYAGGLAIAIYTLIAIFAEEIVAAFSDDPQILADTPNALRWVFAASPVIAIQLIGAAYFQAAGKPLKALMLTLSKQGFFLIPLILTLPPFFGIFGIWISFPIADMLATIVTGLFLKRHWPKI